MKVCFRFFLMGWQKTVAARGAMLLYLCLSVLQTLLAMGVWFIAANSASLQIQVSTRLFLTYFVFIILFQAFIWSGVSYRIGHTDIRKGQLSMYLLRPFPYVLSILLEESSWRILRSLVTVPVFLLFLVAFRNVIQFDTWWFILALLLFPLGYLIYFLVQTLLGVLAFWLQDIEEQGEVIEILMILFSGVGVPIFFFPPILQNISAFLPFQYALYVPTMIAMGQLQAVEIVKYVTIVIVWLTALSSALFVLWRKGLRQYTGEGV